jgi:hypothetical protein
LKGICLRTAGFLSILFTAVAGLFFAGCGIEEPIEKVKFEPKPYTSQLPEAYRNIRLNKSTSADVLEAIKQYESETVSQSESIVVSWGEKKKTYQFWLNMVAFDEEDFAATRKYFLTVDEKPQHLFSEGQKLRFDAEMILDEATLSEPYTSENQKRIAVMKKALENFRNDIMQVRQDSRVLDVGGMMTNQTFERILYILDQSPGFAEKLDRPKGLDFDHLTLGKGRVQMTMDDRIVKIKIRIGRLWQIWDKE